MNSLSFLIKEWISIWYIWQFLCSRLDNESSKVCRPASLKAGDLPSLVFPVGTWELSKDNGGIRWSSCITKLSGDSIISTEIMENLPMRGNERRKSTRPCGASYLSREVFFLWIWNLLILQKNNSKFSIKQNHWSWWLNIPLLTLTSISNLLTLTSFLFLIEK